MSFIDKKDDNDGKRITIEEGFDIVEAGRMEYGFSGDALRVSECVQRFRNGKAKAGDIEILVKLREDMKMGILNGRQNRAIRAIDKLEEM